MMLRVTIRSTFNPSHIYGCAGNEIKMISQCDKVCIVENDMGERFAALQSELTNDRSEIDTEYIPAKAIITHRSMASRKVVAVDINQQALF